MPGQTVYLLFYDQEDGTNRESWSVFYTPYEIFSTEEARAQRKEQLSLEDPGLAFDEHTAIVDEVKTSN